MSNDRLLLRFVIDRRNTFLLELWAFQFCNQIQKRLIWSDIIAIAKGRGTNSAPVFSIQEQHWIYFLLGLCLLARGNKNRTFWIYLKGLVKRPGETRGRGAYAPRSFFYHARLYVILYFDWRTKVRDNTLFTQIWFSHLFVSLVIAMSFPFRLWIVSFKYHHRQRKKQWQFQGCKLITKENRAVKFWTSIFLKLHILEILW